jgi:hypothetical protein
LPPLHDDGALSRCYGRSSTLAHSRLDYLSLRLMVVISVLPLTKPGC